MVAVSTLALLTPLNVQAEDDDLQIAKDANFSNIDDQFSPSQTIYVKAKADSDGSKKKQLNLRDNNYNLITSYTLDYVGSNEFKKTITAPQSSGYYSLEARIESEGSVSTLVKTIEVGNSSSSSINIDVSSRSGGQTISGRSTSPTSSPAVISSPSPSPSPSQSTEPTPQAEQSEEPEKDKGIFAQIKDFFEKLFSIF